MSSKRCVFAQRARQQQNAGSAEIYVYGLDKQKSYTTLTQGWTNKDGEKLDSSKAHGQVNLLLSESSEDRYVLVKSNKRLRIGNNDTRSGGVLLERVSIPGCRGNVRLFRCSQGDLPDFVDWFQFQQTDSHSIYQQPSIIRSGSSGMLSETDFGRCRSTIGSLLQDRSVADLQIILLACYFVANSFRSLSVRELVSAIHRIAKTRFQKNSDFMQEQRECTRELKLLEMTSTIIQTDSVTKVSFITPSMKIFLKRVALPGIERGHETMAEMCLSEIRRFGSAFIARPWHRFRAWFNSPSKWPLMRYASKYWSCHVREAAASNPRITAELFRMINQGVVGKSPSDTPLHLQRQVVKIGHTISRIYDLPQLTEFYEQLGAAGNESALVAPDEAELQDLEYLTHITLSTSKPSTATAYESTRRVLSDFDTLPVSCQGRRRSDSKPQCACSLEPEDKDWEQIDRLDSDRCKQTSERRTDDWDVITQEDYTIN